MEQEEGQNRDSSNGVVKQRNYLDTRPRSKTSPIRCYSPPSRCDLETAEKSQSAPNAMSAMELQLVIVMAIKESKQSRGEKCSENLKEVITKFEQKNWMTPCRDGLGRRGAVYEEDEGDRDMLYRMMMNVLTIKNSKCLS